MTATHEEHSSATEDEHDELPGGTAKQTEPDVDGASEDEVFSAAEQRINELTDSLLRARRDRECSPSQ